MKRLFTLLGLFAIGLALILGTSDTSAKEKVDLGMKKVLIVDDHAALADLILVTDPSLFEGPSTPEWNKFALYDPQVYWEAPEVQSDPYLYRSQSWIRNRNLQMTGILSTFDLRHKGKFLPKTC